MKTTQPYKIDAIMPKPRERAAFRESFTQTHTSQCWLWTAGRTKKTNGEYGFFTFRGKTYGAHRLALIWHTRFEYKGMHACHRCNTPLCVRPSHLYWGSAAENAADKIEAGRAIRGQNFAGAKLSDQAVTDIWSEYYARRASYDQLMQRHGVCRAVIDRIILKKTWRHITSKLAQPDVFPMPRFDAKGTRHGMSVLDPDKVRYLRKQHAAGAQISALARELKVGESTVRNVVRRHTWQHVDD